jgi:hypothetical protein
VYFTIRSPAPAEISGVPVVGVNYDSLGEDLEVTAGYFFILLLCYFMSLERYYESHNVPVVGVSYDSLGEDLEGRRGGRFCFVTRKFIIIVCRYCTIVQLL